MRILVLLDTQKRWKQNTKNVHNSTKGPLWRSSAVALPWLCRKRTGTLTTVS